jgi:hypothetical protein
MPDLSGRGFWEAEKKEKGSSNYMPDHNYLSRRRRRRRRKMKTGTRRIGKMRRRQTQKMKKKKYPVFCGRGRRKSLKHVNRRGEVADAKNEKKKKMTLAAGRRGRGRGGRGGGGRG